jgi:hypothetical protein
MSCNLHNAYTQK